MTSGISAVMTLPCSTPQALRNALYSLLSDVLKQNMGKLSRKIQKSFLYLIRVFPLWFTQADYSKAFLEAHREAITLHKAAKAAFDEAGLQKLPKVKELDAEYAELLIKKKAAYPDYRKARDEMQELMKAQKNVELFFAEDKSNLRPQHTR